MTCSGGKIKCEAMTRDDTAARRAGISANANLNAVAVDMILEELRSSPVVRRGLVASLQQPGVVRLWSGADLFSAALIVGDDNALTPVDAADVLAKARIHWPRGTTELAAHIAQGLKDAPDAFVTEGKGASFATEAAVVGRLKRLGFRLAPSPGRAARPPTPPPGLAERQGRQGRPASSPASTARARSQKQGREAGVARHPPAPSPSPSPPLASAPAGHAAPAGPAVIDAHAVPAAQPFAAPTLVWTPPAPASIAQLLRSPPCSLSEVSLSARAHAIAHAESFTELLSPASLLGLVPHRYQQEAVERVLRVFRGRALLADEVGLGKTIEAVMVLREYQLRGMARRVLILVPAPLVRQWAGELEAKAGISFRTTEDPQLDADPAAFFRGDGLVVASISKARSARVAPHVKETPWDLVIVDEAHHVKNRATLAWKLIDSLESRFLLLLTATPLETDLEELYNLVTLLKPGQFQTPAAFKAQFVDKKNPTSPRNRERLRALLGEVMVRNTRATCGLKLPPRFVTTSVVEPSPAEARLYEGVVEFVRAEAAAGHRGMLAQTLLLEAGSSAEAVQATLERTGETKGSTRQLVTLAKAVQTSRKLEHLKSLLQAHGNHALIFTRYRATVQAIVRALDHAGVGYEAFHGGMTTAEKAAALGRFRDRRCVLVATDVGGEGQNLQHCHTLVNFDIPWNPMLLEQRIGRLHRMGQEREVHVYNLAQKGSAEERLLDVLDRRVHLFELVVGEMDMVIGNVTDDRDLEERVLDLYAKSGSDAELAAGFDDIAAQLLAARGRYEQTRQLDEAVFGEDFGT